MDLKFLDLARFRPNRPAVAAPLAFEGLAQVRGYWEGLRTGGAIPSRMALDPRGLGGVLDRVFLAERIGKGIVQVRIAGSGLADFAGLDLRGLPLSCLFASEARPALADVLEDVSAARSLAEIDLASDRGNGQVVARLLLLPLAEEQDRRMVLGALSFAPGGSPRCKFTILRQQTERLIAPVPNVAPAAVQPEASQRAHLRLVHARD